ncbi:MAG: lamin tail domain-containing protein [Deltaproteobacteria bacterium]|nr:lamin tail domain-containing protein [Deltaproteobacteria bacterium]
MAGPAGCVQDDFGRMSGDAPTLGSTSEGPLLPVTGIDVYDSSGAAPDDSTDGADGSTAADPTGDDASTSGPGDASGSTGEMVDGSTGEMALGIDQLVPGDLVVTEVMWNPSCSQDLCEWFEILNATDETVNLLDLYVQDTDQNAGNQGRITSDVLVGPGDVVVVTRSLNFWPYDFEAGAVYGPNPGLNNGSPDRVVLRNETEVLDQTGIFPLEGTEGIAWSLSGDALDADSNDLSAFWCSATVELPTTSTTEFGTPGQINDPC